MNFQSNELLLMYVLIPSYIINTLLINYYDENNDTMINIFIISLFDFEEDSIFLRE